MDFDNTDRRLILYTKSTGSWMNVRGTMVTGKVLAATEFCDFLCARYNVTPPQPPEICGGCVTSFNVGHTLSCRK